MNFFAYSITKTDVIISRRKDLVIRPIMVADAEDITNHLFSTASFNNVKKDIKADLIKMRRGNYMRRIAVINNNVVGQASFNQLNSPIKQHIVDIEGAVVDKDYQGKGIFSKIMKYGLDWATDKGVEIAIISVRKGVHAQGVYLLMGFTPYGELEGGIKEPWGDKKIYDEIFLYKVIVHS